MSASGWAMAAIVTQGPTPRVAIVITLVRLAVFCYLVLALYASGIVLFQSRLAHAGYTAAPPIEWPDSPAAEAISNAPPLMP
jgi:hypothetical protein